MQKHETDKQNSGFSLVELVIAVAILAIVTGAVCSFIIIGSRGYARGNNEISVQQEAQLALNQMSDVIIDATRSINYVGYDQSNQPVKALKDAEFTFAPEKKALIVYNVATDEEETENPSGTPAPTLEPVKDDRQNYMFYWQKEDETLYFSQMDESGDFPMPLEDGCVVLADHVTDFEADLSQVEERRVVKLHLIFEMGGKSFEMSNTITVRNQVLLNDAQIEPLDRRVRVNVKAKEAYVILEPGEQYHFSTPKLSGMNLMNKEVIWSVADPSVDAQTAFTDAHNGILQISAAEKSQSFQVKVTSVAVNDEDGQPASDTITVYVKRVTKVTLSKLSDDFEGEEEDRPQAMEIAQGATFTVGANVDGIKLLSPCSGCEAAYATDLDVTDFVVLEGAEYVTMDAESVTASQAAFTLQEETPVGTKITIRAVSVLSKRHESTYGPVYGQLTLTVVERKLSVLPFNGMLKHGIATRVDDTLIAGFVTEVSNHVLCVHIVDNETKQMIYEVVCRDDGWNMWISPDLFDLDLKKSYTFYLQAIESVSKADYAAWQKDGGAESGGIVRVSTDEEIWAEYSANRQTKAPFGYTGTKFNCSEVYGTLLEPVEFAYSYHGNLYCGESFSLDPFNIPEQNIGYNQVNILGEVVFEKADGKTKNIDFNSLNSGVKYSVYKGEGNDRTTWEKLYVYDPESGNYRGQTSFYDGNLVIEDYAGMRALKLKAGKIQETSGTYHIVPGYVYRPKDKAAENAPKYILGPAGFSFPYHTAEERYYELSESTYHITITAEGTMDVESADFEGSVCFPLPKQMKAQTYFPNMEATDWQEANLGNSGLSLQAIEESTGNLIWITFDRVRYRKIQDQDAYEVEPLKIMPVSNGNGLEIQYSYGIYKCAANGTKWECEEPAEMTTNATFSFSQNGKTYVAYVPLPADQQFLFQKEQPGRQKLGWAYSFFGFEQKNLMGYNNSVQFSSNDLYCDYEEESKVYTLMFVKEVQWKTNFRSVLKIAGKYSCAEDGRQWSKTSGETTMIESTANLRSVYPKGDGVIRETYVPEPDDQSFWGGSWSENQQTTDEKTLEFYQPDVDENANYCYGCRFTYYKKNGKYQISILQNGHQNTDFGTFEWNQNLKQWISLSGN